ncbi:UDP-Glycosyltransferase superfamily protein [Zostera marina]|uniref:UDP-Glycosyltransferase superfamily protein n=1 Tax=Zostera marina TaxID=29655 RepID=A0A0K9NTG6_ZOSMR|nr:UDP-Glycosyltransferase superfamily protein [Zostera marina]
MASTTKSQLIGRISLRAKCILLLALFTVLSLSFILGGAFLNSCQINRDDSNVHVLRTVNPTNGNDMEEENPLEFMRSKKVILISHELTLSGGPLLLMELAFLLRVVDAKVVWITNQHTDEKNKVTHSLVHKMLDRGVQVSYPRTKEALDATLKSDLIILNTAVSGKWLDNILQENGQGILPKVLWWIHEMRGHYCSLDYVKNLPSVAGTMIDSHISADFWKNRTHNRLGLTMPQTSVVHLGNSKELMEVAEDSVAKRILRQHIRGSLGIQHDDLLFSIINSVSRGKGQHYFLRAFIESLQLIKERNLKVPKMYAAVVGSDFNAQFKFEMELRDIVSENGLQDVVHFVNKSLTVVPYLAATDILIQNSQGRGECFGRITIEAMAFQVPVLGTAAGGTTEIVVDGVTGMLHPEGKNGVSVLAENIIKLATQAETRLNMGRNGYNRVKEMFLEKHMAQRIGDVLKSILQNSKTSQTSTKNFEK